MRVLSYSHDSYGLGHIQRTFAIARQLNHDLPGASQLLVTGSMQSHCFELPARLDYLKLPAISKRSTGEYQARVLRLPLDDLIAFRENLIFDAMQHFKPDLVLVDKTPAGIHGEMVRSLRYLKAERPETKLVLGMRDIEDDPATVRVEWTRQGVYPLLEDTYDTILLYGIPTLYDPVREYGFSTNVAAKMISCGYLGRRAPVRLRDEIRRELDLKTDCLVTVTAGGGGDGFELMHTYLEMLVNEQGHGKIRFDSLVILGPLMPSEERAFLRRYETRARALKIVDFIPDLVSHLNAADLVISMGGYNSICEILSLRKRAVIVPRVKPRIEQRIRAERLAARGLVRLLLPSELSSARLLTEINAALSDNEPISPEEAGLEMNGAANASLAIVRLLKEKRHQLSPFV